MRHGSNMSSQRAHEAAPHTSLTPGLPSTHFKTLMILENHKNRNKKKRRRNRKKENRSKHKQGIRGGGGFPQPPRSSPEERGRGPPFPFSSGEHGGGFPQPGPVLPRGAPGDFGRGIGPSDLDPQDRGRPIGPGPTAAPAADLPTASLWGSLG